MSWPSLQETERPEKYKIYLSWGSSGPHFRNGFQQLVLPDHHVFNRAGQSCSSLATTKDEVKSPISRGRIHPAPNRAKLGGCCVLAASQLPCNQWREIRHCHGWLTTPGEVSAVGGLNHPWGGPLHRCSQHPRSQQKLHACFSILYCMTRHFFLCYLAHT